MRGLVVGLFAMVLVAIGCLPKGSICIPEPFPCDAGTWVSDAPIEFTYDCPLPGGGAYTCRDGIDSPVGTCAAQGCVRE